MGLNPHSIVGPKGISAKVGCSLSTLLFFQLSKPDIEDLIHRKVALKTNTVLRKMLSRTI
jgi:hypothetical protein